MNVASNAYILSDRAYVKTYNLWKKNSQVSYLRNQITLEIASGLPH